MIRGSWCCLFILLMTLPVVAVELSESEYELAKQDFSAVLSGKNTLLQFLVAEPDARLQTTIYRTANPRQGEMLVRQVLPKEGLLILQIPHGYFDLHTREIAEFWWQQGIAHALMLNTEQRYKTKHSDMSRLRYSLFTAFTEALLEVLLENNPMKAHIIQLHGFNEKKRNTSSGGGTDFILSNGTLLPDGYLQRMQICLRDNGALLARIYGRDVFELGATINPVGKLVNAARQLDSSLPVSFLHVEISRSVRNKLVQQELPKAAIRCLLES